jgi:hypothetical protein
VRPTTPTSNLLDCPELDKEHRHATELLGPVSPHGVTLPQRAASTFEEREFARAVEAWLRERSLPESRVLWFPHWNRECPQQIACLAQLSDLIGGLDGGDWGGIRRATGDGRWAQVKCMPDRKSFLELHPYQHDRASRPFVWDSFPDLNPAQAAARALQWVQPSLS